MDVIACSLAMYVMCLSTQADHQASVDRDLIIACHNADREAVVRALRNGADINATYGETSLDPLRTEWDQEVYGIAQTWTPLIALMRHSGDYPASARRYRSDASLHKRYSKRELEAIGILYILLSHGCDLEAITKHFGNRTALHVALRCRHPEMAQMLIKWGANIHARNKGYFDGPHDQTPLHLACWSKEITEMLLQAGADPLAKDSLGITPFGYAAIEGKPSVCNLYQTSARVTGDYWLDTEGRDVLIDRLRKE